MTAALIDRELELSLLRETARTRPALIIVRGRRRVGKSFLLAHAFEGPRTILFQADEQPESVQLELVAREAARLLPGAPPLRFESWLEALAFFEAQARSAALTVVLDEFQYLCAGQPALPSIIQREWDRWAREQLPLVLVICGSALTLMEDLLAGGAPLHGRSDYRPLIEPLDYRQAAGFTPDIDPVRAIERYAVLGGTPQYQVWAGRRRLGDVIGDVILAPGGALHEEPDHLVRKEDGVRDPMRYLSALEAIAAGRTRTGEIASRLGMNTGNTSRLLERLARLGYLESRMPIGDRRGGARSAWRIRDPFLRFWFRYVRPNRSRLESGRIDEVMHEIELDLPGHTGLVFEDCCRTWLARYSDLGAAAEQVGSWWSRDGRLEIDVAAADRRGYSVLGSCKWTRAAMGSSTLDALYEARAVLGPRAAQAKLALFARSAFTPGLVQRAAEEGATLVTAGDLFGP